MNWMDLSRLLECRDTRHPHDSHPVLRLTSLTSVSAPQTASMSQPVTNDAAGEPLSATNTVLTTGASMTQASSCSAPPMTAD